MTELIQEIERAAGLLKRVDASSLVYENLQEVESGLRDNALSQAVQQFRKTLGPEPHDESERERYREKARLEADQLNHIAEQLLKELERVKKIRQTLNLEALDPIIREARAIIHRVHGLTAELQ